MRKFRVEIVNTIYVLSIFSTGFFSEASPLKNSTSNVLEARSLGSNSTASSLLSWVLPAPYAKVTRYGAGEGRSSSGQTLYSQRSEASIVNSQNARRPVAQKPSQPEITYHYSMVDRPSGAKSISNSRAGVDARNEQLPAKGEVVTIQERYNPKPYFEYDPVPPKSAGVKASSASSSSGGPPSVVYGAPFDSFPSFTQGNSDGPPPPSAPAAAAPPKTEVDIKPSVNLYNSPFDSYAAPPSGPVYPPNDPSPPPPPPVVPRKPTISYGPPISPPSAMYLPAQSKPPPPPPPMIKDSYSGPFAPPPPSNGDDDSGDKDAPPPPSGYDNHHHHDHGTVSDQGPNLADTVGPPDDAQQPYYDYPPKDYHHHHHHQHDDDGHSALPPAPAMMDSSAMSGPDNDDPHHHHAPPHHHHHHDDGSADLSPPPSASGPSGPTGGGGASSLGFAPKLPDFVEHDPYGSAHGHQYVDHHPHVYHEIEHHHPPPPPPTTEAPEDMRVNKGHYSYYYLGRKLYYVPLYFSVYFIVYITVLILKSIARHKVNLVHEYDKGKGRSIDGGREERVQETAARVDRALDEGAQRYM